MLIENKVWTEKYRPKNVNDCILPLNIKQIFQSYVDKNDIPHLLLSGGAGCGKTTIARALCDQLDFEYIFINGSEERGIDVIRNTLRQFCSTVSFDGRRKAVIIDESDNLTSTTQSAMRAFIDEFANTCRFIFTCNYKNRIIEPLQSRLSSVDFIFIQDEQKKLKVELVKRLETILKDEQVEYEIPALVELIKKYYPDNRRILNELQKYAKFGRIDSGILTSTNSTKIDEIIDLLRKKNYTELRKWTASNLSDVGIILRQIYDSAYETVDRSSIPALGLLINEYQYKSSFVADQEINLMAFFTEVMTGIKFKEVN